jgi:hypothetical protein
VAAVVGDPGHPGAPFLKDRLYLDYQEAAAIQPRARSEPALNAVASGQPSGGS